MQYIFCPKSKMNASEYKQPEHSSQKKTGCIQILFCHSFHYHSKTITKQNGEKCHEFILNEDRMQCIKKIIKRCGDRFYNCVGNIVCKHAIKVSHQYAE